MFSARSAAIDADYPQTRSAAGKNVAVEAFIQYAAFNTYLTCAAIAAAGGGAAAALPPGLPGAARGVGPASVSGLWGDATCGPRAATGRPTRTPWVPRQPGP